MEGGTLCIFNPVEWNCLVFAGQNIRRIPYPLGSSVEDAPKSFWAFSCVPGAVHCISPWMDFYFYIFCHSHHLGFTFSTTLYSSFSLCLVIWKCCSRGTTFTVLRSRRSCYLSIPEQISLMDFGYCSINVCFIPYFHILNQEENQILAKRQKKKKK